MTTRLSFWSAPAGCSLFSSHTVTRHLLRGVVGALLVIWAIGNALVHPFFALAAGVVGVVAWRGCPMCWTVGLLETIGYRLGHARVDDPVLPDAGSQAEQLQRLHHAGSPRQ